MSSASTPPDGRDGLVTAAADVRGWEVLPLVGLLVAILAAIGWLALSLACTVLAAVGLLLTTAGLLRGFDALRRLVRRPGRS